MSGRGGVHLLGVPFSSNGRPDGVALGPAALREAGLVDGLSAAGVDVTDRGNVELGGATTARDPSSGIIDPTALVEMIRAVRAEVHAIREAGAFPLVIGGDCPILLGCLEGRGVASPPGLLFVDGHEDAWPPVRSTTGEAADMELGLALGVTVEGLPDSLASELPRLEPDRVVVIGPRDARELAEAGVSSISDVVHVVRPDAVAAAGADRVGADAVSHLRNQRQKRQRREEERREPRRPPEPAARHEAYREERHDDVRYEPQSPAADTDRRGDLERREHQREAQGGDYDRIGEWM